MGGTRHEGLLPTVRILACHKILGYLSLQQNGDQLLRENTHNCTLATMTNAELQPGDVAHINYLTSPSGLQHTSAGGAPPDRDGQYHLERLCIAYLTTLSETRSNRGKTKAVSQQLPGATESNYKKTERRQPSPDRDLNLGNSQ